MFLHFLPQLTYYAICPDIDFLTSAATDFFLQLGTGTVLNSSVEFENYPIQLYLYMRIWIPSYQIAIFFLFSEFMFCTVTSKNFTDFDALQLSKKATHVCQSYENRWGL